VAHNGVVAGGGRLTDQISIGVLAASVARDAVDDAVAVTGRQARRSDGKLPPHVMVYFAMAMACSPGDPRQSNRGSRHRACVSSGRLVACG
jgi:hypothetical protein